MGLLQDGWHAFDALQNDVNDGAEMCQAELRADHGRYGETWIYSGDTSAGRGHAEMDALHKFITHVGWDASKRYPLTIVCPAKSCCVYCAAILGLLGVRAAEGTFKTNRKMGSIAYALHPDIVNYLAWRFGKSHREIRIELSDSIT